MNHIKVTGENKIVQTEKIGKVKNSARKSENWVLYNLNEPYVQLRVLILIYL